MYLRRSILCISTIALSLILSNASPLPLINSTTAVPGANPPIDLVIPLLSPDLVLTIRSHAPTPSPLDLTLIPGFITAASLNLYALIHDGGLARGAITRFEHTYSFRSRTTGYRMLWWGGEYRDYRITYGDLAEALQGLTMVASGLYEEVDLEVGFVEEGTRPVTGRIWRELVRGVDVT